MKRSNHRTRSRRVSSAADAQQPTEASNAGLLSSITIQTVRAIYHAILYLASPCKEDRWPVLYLASRWHCTT